MLLPHNQKAHDAVMQSFAKGRTRAAIVHATGTGKSYIIAAVAQHFSNVLVVTPRELIIEDMKKVFDENADENGSNTTVTFRTYTGILFNYHALKGFDLIVLDEFHHAGAKEWGRCITNLIDDNLDAHLLGTSATPVRQYDHGRNMADDMFDGNVVSELTLAQAIGTILPTPVYVRSIWDFDKTERILLDNIASAKRTNEWKNASIDIVRRQCLDWKRSKGVPQILRKYLKDDMRHIIMFVPNIIEGMCMQVMMSQWMHSARFCDIKFFEINSAVSGVNDVMQEYKTDNGHTIHIAIAVNMLNEGVHIEGVDCIIMLRNTRSATIVEQQLGRCLTASSKRPPLVLDFVNNITLVYAFKRRKKNAEAIEEDGTPDEGTPLFDAESTTRFEPVKLPFQIIDECTELDKLIRSISRNLAGYTIEWLKEVALKYKTRSEWKNSSDHKSYVWASRHGVIAEVTEHMGPVRRKKLTYEECVAVARTCNSRAQFQHDYPACYHKMRRMKWMTEDILPSTRKSHTKEECIEMCKEYKSLKELRENNRNLYCYITQHGWLKACFKEAITNKYTKDLVCEIASHYSRLIDFKRAKPGAYNAARRNGWMNEIGQHLSRRTTIKDITHQDFLDAVAQVSSRSELFDKFGLIYKCANKNGWLTPDILPRKTQNETRTDEQLITECKKYSDRSSLRKADQRLYDAARRRKLLPRAFPHYKERCKKVTLGVILQRASQYDSYSDFIHAEQTSAQTCARRGWIPAVKIYFENKNKTITK